jgi:hypothetical protein
MTGTHTYALLEISAPAFNEIAQKLAKAGYAHAFTGNREIDMHGIGLAPDPNIKPGTTTIETLSILSARTKEGKVQLRVNEAQSRHPDLGGTDIEMAHLNRARDYALMELTP